ncbi:MAG TPA: peptidylprolyl isomerase [Phycisphaerales bacterium]|nr:peptidylprolyl isomerase [Phycisphaerales bacterium]
MSSVRLMTAVMGLALAIGGTGALAQPGKPEDKPTQPPSVVQPKKDEKKVEPPAPAKEQLAYVQLQTSMGDILLELNQTKAPLSVENFLRYVEKGHYNGTVFHRVIDGFMIQGGGFDSAMKQKPTDSPIKNEWQNGLKNHRYTVAMARTSNPDSATAQFYINVADNNSLDRASPMTGGAGYAVFGRVVAGKDVVDKIKAVKTTFKGGMPDVPAEEISIRAARKLTEEEATKIKNAGETKPADAKPADTAPAAPKPAKPEEKK